MTQKERNRILKQHRQWLETDGVEGQRADLEDANLRRAGFELARLYFANLCDADLRGTDLEDANLQNADLRDADLRNANLRNADFRCAKLQGAELDTNIRNCWSFAGAKFASDALPWLILHPKWAEFKGTVQILPN